MLQTRINSKWIKDLNVCLETIKLIDENIDSKISGISHSNIFFWYIFPCKGDKIKHKQVRLHQTKKFFCIAKKIINKMKRQPTEWENIFANTSGKGLIFKIYKELYPWLVWLSCLAIILQTKRSSVQFPVGAHAWAVGSVPGWGVKQPIDVSLPHFLPPFSSL